MFKGIDNMKVKTTCDNDNGPCSCGAWHKPEHREWTLQDHGDGGICALGPIVRGKEEVEGENNG